MNPKLVVIGAFVLALPVGVDVPGGGDSTGSGGQTRIRLAGGAGYYALIDRGCHGEVVGQHPVHFEEAGAQIEHAFPGRLVLGVRAGLLRDRFDQDPASGGSRTIQNSYVNPYVASEAPGAGIGIGWVVADRNFTGRDAEGLRLPISGHLRIGDPAGNAFTIRLMEAVPLYSGCGYFDAGFGSIRGRSDVWAGISAGGPYDGVGLGLRGGYEVVPGTHAALQVRVGRSGRASQNGLSLALEQRIPARR